MATQQVVDLTTEEATTEATTEATKPLILLVSLNLASSFDDDYASLCSQLKSKANLQRVEEKSLAIRLLSKNPRPLAVLVTDESIALDKNSRAWEAVSRYVLQGGTAVVMGHFPCFISPDQLRPFFAKAGVPWDALWDRHTTVVLNKETVGDDLAARLPPRYNQKALFIRNVEPTDIWYVMSDDSVVKSYVFAPAPIEENVHGETSVALKCVGTGKLGYIGDVNAGEELTAIVLAMCGLPA
ncbi:hypothetical protein F4821DRAFT_280557 [Hypoxylon rubiginosum]|uniref:Uncharacterized protein n=1 Tax=Hypoxylon rubiginosum TaxID=110542 RepID=A0ACC0CTU3_9PEZI|nr:hypothetical protein F4821DRAFT_280557 [Hypoxylon rubiginosum]